MYFLNADSSGGIDYMCKEIGYKNAMDQPTLTFVTHEVKTNILWDGATFTISNDNGSYTKVFSGTFGNGLNLYLFGFNDNGSVERIGNTKIYRCKIYWKNTLVRDFIPAKRKSDNAICMYDRVTQTFYTNAGTGTFTAGPEINTALYEELEYIESTGTQYIDTGLIMSTSMRIEMQYKLLAIAVGQCIIGESVAGWNYYAAGLSGIANRYGIDYGSTAIIRRDAATSDKVDTVITNTSLQNGAYTDTATRVLRNNDGTLCLLHNGSYPSDKASARIYCCKIYWNNILVRDFIPVKRTSDNEVCMYDKVSHTFITNAGTGTFIAGPTI
jgi:hypothetical protein